MYKIVHVERIISLPMMPISHRDRKIHHSHQISATNSSPGLELCPSLGGLDFWQ